MLLLIDNYDSFTWNLVHYIGETLEARRGDNRVAVETAGDASAPPVEEEIVVKRNDEITVEEAMALRPDAIVLSPGPCDPDRAGVCLDLVAAASPSVPLLGVCLGHQAIGQAFGGSVVRAGEIVHGKTSTVRHGGGALFADLPNPLTMTRYHSLVVDRDRMPDALEITAETDDGVVMAVRHRSRPTFGVQFHPESIASQNGKTLLENFLRIAEIV